MQRARFMHSWQQFWRLEGRRELSVFEELKGGQLTTVWARGGHGAG